MKDELIEINEGQKIKKSKLLTLYEEHLVKPLFNLFNKSEITKKQVYADTIIQNGLGELLLLQRSTQDDFEPGKWCLPGGKVEEGEEIDAAAKREFEEETGLSTPALEFIKTVEKDNAIIHYYKAVFNDIFLPILDNEEHYHIEFVPLDKIQEYDLLLDLRETIKGIELASPTTLLPEYASIEEQIARTRTLKQRSQIIQKSFNEEKINSEEFVKSINQIKNAAALTLIARAFDDDTITSEEFCNTVLKAQASQPTDTVPYLSLDNLIDCAKELPNFELELLLTQN